MLSLKLARFDQSDSGNILPNVAIKMMKYIEIIERHFLIIELGYE